MTAPIATVRFRVAFRRLFLLRLAGTVSLRFAYPFLPLIATGLHTSIAGVGVGLACGEAAGLFAPLVGRRLDRVGRRRGMIDGLVVSSVGCAGIAASPSVAAFGASLFVVAVGRYFFDVSFNAWIGDEVEFDRRGWVNGIGELTWSGAFLVGVPIAGLIAVGTSWRVPYALSAVLLLASIPVVRATLEPRSPRLMAPGTTIAHARPTVVHLAIFATSLGAAVLFVIEGAWFDVDLGMTDRAISVVVVLLGIGEVVGSLLSALLTDRIGKRNAMAAGLGVLVPAAAAFALVGHHQLAGVAAALLVGLGFELAFVSALPLVVEVDEAHRAGAMGLAVAALTGARTVAAVVATRVFDSSGIDLVVAISIPSLVVAAAVVLAAVRDPSRVAT